MQFYPGKYKIEKLQYVSQDGTSADITDLFLELDVNSTINTFTNEIIVSISDAVDIIGKLGMRGGDRLNFDLSYGSNGAQKYTYVVRKISRMQYAGTQKVFTIECVSELSYISTMQKISKSYSGKIDEIAAMVFQDSKTNEELNVVEKSLNSQTLIIPDWNPVYSLRWLAGRAKTQYNTRMRFFQDSKMRYNFTSIENIVNQSNLSDNLLTYTYSKNVNRVNEDGNIFSIDDVTFHDAYNNFKLNTDGYYKGESFVFDIFTKQSSVNTFDRFKIKNEIENLNKYLVTETLAYDGVGKKVDSIAQSAIQGSGTNKVFDASNIKQTNFWNGNQSITIKVKGNEFVDIGQVVNIEIPKFAPRDEFDMIDYEWSGKYLIAGKRDLYKTTEHVMYLQLYKDSMAAGYKA